MNEATMAEVTAALTGLLAAMQRARAAIPLVPGESGAPFSMVEVHLSAVDDESHALLCAALGPGKEWHAGRSTKWAQGDLEVLAWWSPARVARVARELAAAQLAAGEPCPTCGRARSEAA